jgi:uncharacterized cupin superfamily protein
MSDSSLKSMPQVISFQDPLPESRRYRPQVDRILSGDPVQTSTSLFHSADGRFNAGIWEAMPGKWRVVFTESEFCHLLAGVIVVTGDDGSQPRLEQATLSSHQPALLAPGKSLNPRESSTQY